MMISTVPIIVDSEKPSRLGKVVSVVVVVVVVLIIGNAFVDVIAIADPNPELRLPPTFFSSILPAMLIPVVFLVIVGWVWVYVLWTDPVLLGGP